MITLFTPTTASDLTSWIPLSLPGGLYLLLLPLLSDISNTSTFLHGHRGVSSLRHLLFQWQLSQQKPKIEPHLCHNHCIIGIRKINRFTNSFFHLNLNTTSIAIDDWIWNLNVYQTQTSWHIKLTLNLSNVNCPLCLSPSFNWCDFTYNLTSPNFHVNRTMGNKLYYLSVISVLLLLS